MTLKPFHHHYKSKIGRSRSLVLILLSALLLSGCTLFEPGVGRRIVRLDEMSKEMKDGVEYHDEQELKEEKQQLQDDYQRRTEGTPSK